MILTPKKDRGTHYHDPYTQSGARSVLRRFSHDVIAMLDYMDYTRKQYDDGRTMLANSPLRSKIYVAAAMKTMGFIEEHETDNGACALTLTDKAITQMENIKRFL